MFAQAAGAVGASVAVGALAASVAAVLVVASVAVAAGFLAAARREDGSEATFVAGSIFEHK